MDGVLDDMEKNKEKKKKNTNEQINFTLPILLTYQRYRNFSMLTNETIEFSCFSQKRRKEKILQ